MFSDLRYEYGVSYGMSYGIRCVMYMGTEYYKRGTAAGVKPAQGQQRGTGHIGHTVTGQMRPLLNFGLIQGFILF